MLDTAHYSELHSLAVSYPAEHAMARDPEYMVQETTHAFQAVPFKVPQSCMQSPCAILQTLVFNSNLMHTAWFHSGKRPLEKPAPAR